MHNPRWEHISHRYYYPWAQPSNDSFIFLIIYLILQDHGLTHWVYFSIQRVLLPFSDIQIWNLSKIFLSSSPSKHLPVSRHKKNCWQNKKTKNIFIDTILHTYCFSYDVKAVFMKTSELPATIVYHANPLGLDLSFHTLHSIRGNSLSYTTLIHRVNIHNYSDSHTESLAKEHCPKFLDLTTAYATSKEFQVTDEILIKSDVPCAKPLFHPSSWRDP